MSGVHGEGRLEVEKWEMELANRIAGSFRPSDEDLAAVLMLRLVELKVSKRAQIRNWQAFLVQSLYNAAKNFIRHEDVLHRHVRSVEFGDDLDRDQPSRFEENLVAPEQPTELAIDVPKVWEALTPEMRELWLLLFEEEGNISAVAKRLGQPRKTVDYWIGKLKTVVRDWRID